MTDDQLESRYFEELTNIDHAEKHNYARIGIVCREVKNRLLWQKRIDPDTKEPFKSLTRWIKAACPWSYTTANAALRDVEELNDIPDEHLKEIPSSNFPVLKQLSTATRSEDDIIQGAKTKHTDDFVEQIRDAHPEQHLESKKLMRFMPEESAVVKIEEALEMAKKHGAHNRNDALELIAQTAVEQWQLEEEVEEIVRRIPDALASE